MPDEDKNFCGSLGLNFRKWWRHLQAKNKFYQGLEIVLNKETRVIVTLLSLRPFRNSSNQYLSLGIALHKYSDIF